MNNSKLILLIWFSMLILSPALIFNASIGDELPHKEQIMNFINDNYSSVYYLTVIPGYHFIIASTAKILHIDRMPWIRLLSLIICSVFSLYIFNQIAKNDNEKLLTFIYLPIIFPFYFLIYTDILSMCMVLFAFYFMTKKGYLTSSLFAGLSILIRQNNIIWLGFILLYIWIDEYGFELDPDKMVKNIPIYLKKIYGNIVPSSRARSQNTATMPGSAPEP